MKQIMLVVMFLLFFVGARTHSASVSTENATEKEVLIEILTQNPLLPKDLVRTILYNPDIEKDERQLADSCVSLLESYSDIYALLGERSLEMGEEFYQKHKTIFLKTKELYGINSEYILGILRVETYFGICTGEFRVLPRLYYLYAHVPEKKEFALREIESFLELVL